MTIAALESDLYQKLRLLLRQQLVETGIPHLKLDLELKECPISQSVTKISILESIISHEECEQPTPAYLEYPYQIEQAITFQENKIGKVVLNIPKSDFPNSRFSEVFESLSDDITRILWRNKLRLVSMKYFSQPLAWAGESNSLLTLEKAIEKSSNKADIFVISGEPRSGKVIAGCSIHAFSATCESPFIVANCVDWQDQKHHEVLDTLIKKTGDGTLYIRHFDLISQKDQASLLLKLTQSIRSSKVIFAVSNESNTKIIDEIKTNNVIKIELPTLNQRSADIEILGGWYLNNFATTNLPKVDEVCWDLLKVVDWSSGFEQLEQLMFRLANYSNKSIFELADLMELLPQLGISMDDEVRCSTDQSITRIAKDIASDNFSENYTKHPTINRALLYVAKNFTRGFDLSMLARNACVSPSHLSYLFRSELNTNFKQMLNLCRIEKSMILLKENPRMQITEISSNLGFCDLSHFEKTFKKITKHTPNEFRRKSKKINFSNLHLITETIL